jgi:hypothetical protein
MNQVNFPDHHSLRKTCIYPSCNNDRATYGVFKVWCNEHLVQRCRILRTRQTAASELTSYNKCLLGESRYTAESAERQIELQLSRHRLSQAFRHLAEAMRDEPALWDNNEFLVVMLCERALDGPDPYLERHR